MTPAPAPPPAEAHQCISTAAGARALLAIILAPLHAFIEARIADLLSRLEDMLTQWRNGTLLPPPPERPRATRPATPRAAATPPAAAYAEEPWLARLIALAASDQPDSVRNPRARRAPTPKPDESPARPLYASPPMRAPVHFGPAWRLGGKSLFARPNPKPNPPSKNPSQPFHRRTPYSLR